MIIAAIFGNLTLPTRSWGGLKNLKKKGVLGQIADKVQAVIFLPFLFLVEIPPLPSYSERESNGLLPAC